MHEGECGTCQHEKDCRSFLEKEAAERGIELNTNDLNQMPAQLALMVFGRYLGV
jgi:hypothetical protein